jgi:hypothetical protein
LESNDFVPKSRCTHIFMPFTLHHYATFFDFVAIFMLLLALAK